MHAEQTLNELIHQVTDGSSTETIAASGITSVPQTEVKQPLPDADHALRVAKDEAEMKYNHALESHGFALAFGIPLLVMAFALLAAYEDRFFTKYAPDLGKRLGFFWGILILWTVVSLIALPIYYFVFYKRYISAKEAFTKIEQIFIATRLSTNEARKQYYREELFRLSSKAARVFFGDEARFSEASAWSKKAGDILDGTDNTASLSVVQSSLNSLNELVTREEQEQKDETRWQYAALVVMILYFAVLVVAAVYINRHQEVFSTVIVGIPLSVILWGAAGSLAAILYRFYTEQGRIRFAAEFRWLIARPVIGIIMGAVVYLALISGMILISSQTSAPAPPGGVRMETFWIIAFLAGFSDKFYLGVIDLLVARTVRTEEVDSNTIVTEKSRIPDNSDGASNQSEQSKKP